MANKKDKTGDLTKELKEELETFDGADPEVSVEDGEVASPPPKDVDVVDAEIIEDEPEQGEDVDDEPDMPEEPKVDKAVTMSREELEAAGVIPPGPKKPKQPEAVKKDPLAEAVQAEVGAPQPQVAQPQMQPAQLTQQQQDEIFQHQSQQGSIALKLIEAQLANASTGSKAKPEALVERAYKIVDALQGELDKRHKDALMKAFTELNS